MAKDSAPPNRFSWKVAAVFDPDGQGQDFAYTVGLGPEHPELHVWARPTDGDDPGANWKLSPEDCMHFLNQTARDVLDGSRKVGDSWSDTHDGGLTTIVWTLTPPEPSPTHDTFMLEPGTAVCSIRWELQRCAAGEEGLAVSTEVASMIVDHAVGLDAERAHRHLLCGAVEHDSGDIDVSPSGQFGPWTSVLSRVRHALLAEPDPQIDDPVLEFEAATALLALDGSHLSYLLGELHALGRKHGRQGPLEAALDAAAVDARELAESFSDYFVAQDEMEGLTAHLLHVLAVSYGGWVLRDHLTDEKFSQTSGFVAALVLPESATRRFWEFAMDTARPQVTEALERARRRIDDGDEVDADIDWLAASAVCARCGVGAPISPQVSAEHLGLDEVSWAAHCELATVASVVATLLDR
jgi:hypothetical protein